MDEKKLTNLIEKLLNKKLNPIMETLNEVKSKMATINKIEQSLSFLSDKYDELFLKVITLEDSHNEIAKENKFLKESLHRSTNNIELMKQELNNLEQYSRSECLEIRGILVQPGEETNEIVRKVGEVIGVAIESKDISISHRLPVNRNNRNMEPTIITNLLVATFAMHCTRQGRISVKLQHEILVCSELPNVKFTYQKV